jgi:RecB family exonuclease
LVSPLAWFLGELDALDAPWAPETLDTRLKGSLAHDVMENLFPAHTALPEPEAIPKAVTRLLAQSIRRLAPFLQGAPWSIERKTLEREILKAARNWRTALAAHGAEVLANEITLAGDAHGIIISGRADCILRLDGGRILIVDHKKSGSKARRERMEAGWDLQLGLYRAMLMRPLAGEDDPLRVLLDGATPGVAYHLMNDSGILQNGLSFNLPGTHIETLSNDISEAAIERLQGRLAEVGDGQIRLNGLGDEAFFKKTAKLTPYALEASPLIAAFLMPSETGDD